MDALYMSCMTGTAVGYGDHSPQSQEGRIVAVFWVLVSVVAVSRALGGIADVMLEQRRKRIEQDSCSHL